MERLVIIGPGRLGLALGAALIQAQVPLSLRYHGRHPDPPGHPLFTEGRAEYRYGLDAVNLCLLDAGHIAQNLSLAAEAIGAGVCGIGAYDQAAIDPLLGLDGRDEMVVYYSPVGKVATAG